MYYLQAYMAVYIEKMWKYFQKVTGEHEKYILIGISYFILYAYF